MLNKEECEKSLENLLKMEKSGVLFMILRVIDDLACFKNLIEEHFNPQPYKFEYLKPNMFVFDKDFNGWGEILRIVETYVDKYGDKIVKCLATGDSSLQTRSYKENRFFPLTKAMEYQKDNSFIKNQNKRKEF